MNTVAYRGNSPHLLPLKNSMTMTWLTIQMSMKIYLTFRSCPICSCTWHFGKPPLHQGESTFRRLILWTEKKHVCLLLKVNKQLHSLLAVKFYSKQDTHPFKSYASFISRSGHQSVHLVFTIEVSQRSHFELSAVRPVANLINILRS